MKPKRSLEEYAKANPERRQLSCWVCSLPADVRRELEKGKSSGRSTPLMVRWLVSDCGIHESEATPRKLLYHFSHEKRA